MQFRLLLLPALGALILSCSDSSDPTEPGDPAGPIDPADQPAMSLVLGSSSVAVTPGQGATLAVNITRTGGFTGAVALSLTDAPDGLTGSFSPSSIPAGATSSTLTLSAATTTALGTYSLTVGASGQAVEGKSAALAVTVEAAQAGSWSALGEGVDGAVHAIVDDDDGNVYVAGSFARAGGATVNNIAKWDGSSWSALGTGITGLTGFTAVNALALDGDGNLYAGGRFNTAGGVEAWALAKWDGSSWSALEESPLNAFSNGVQALAVDSDGNLYVGAHFVTGIGVPVRIEGIARWNGSAWSGVGNFYDEDHLGRVTQGISGTVRALVIDESDNVYIGGIISRAGGEAFNGIVKWDGEGWSGLGQGVGGVGGWISSLALDGNGNLYAGGQFTVAGNVIADNVAVWNGTEWNVLGGGIQTSSLLQGVWALETDRQGRLYAGGSFTVAGGAPASYLAVWDGTRWGPLDEDQVMGPAGVDALRVDGMDNLYVGGLFWGDYTYLAKWRW